MFRTRILALSLAALSLGGCVDSEPEQPKAEKKGIFGKTTQEIGQFDPNSKDVVSDQKVRATDPILAPLQAYGPIMEQISKLGIDQAVALFHASEGRYPKDYDEFMQRIVKENNIRLPVLPFGGRYVYDEATHSLKIVRSGEDDAKKKAAE
ncbi:MAG: hypothetical protein ACT4QC_23400 [Planctomycetaceae bacterium]